MSNAVSIKSTLKEAGVAKCYRIMRGPDGEQYPERLVMYQSQISGKGYSFWEKR